VKSIFLLLVCIVVLIFSFAMFAFPNKPDLDPNKMQGMLNFARKGEYINGTQTWVITEIDQAFFAHLRNYTVVKLQISGMVNENGRGSVYVNNHYVGAANASQTLNEWNVPVSFCDLTTIIKVVSKGWEVKNVNLLFYVKFSDVPPWWKQNIPIIFLAFLAETIVMTIIIRRVAKWIKTA
jgi:hypothetical protein